MLLQTLWRLGFLVSVVWALLTTQRALICTHPFSWGMSLTIHLIGCFVCFVWGASEEGLALQVIGVLEYTPPSPLFPYTSHSRPILLVSFLYPSFVPIFLNPNNKATSFPPLLRLIGGVIFKVAPLVFSCSAFQKLRYGIKHIHVFDWNKAFFLSETLPPPRRKNAVTFFPGRPPAAPVPLTRNIQLIYPWLLRGLWSCTSIGSIWERCREVIYNNHFQWLIIPRPNNPKTQFPTALFIKVTDG